MVGTFLFQGCVYLDMLAHHLADQFHQIRNQGGQIQVDGLDDLAAGERQQLPRQGGRPLRATLDLVQIMQRIPVSRHPPAQEFPESDDSRQGIVEIVRDAPREGAHRLHLLGRPHLLLERQQLRDIPEVPEKVFFPGNRHRTRRDLSPPDRAVLSPYRDFTRHLGFLLHPPSKCIENTGEILLGVDIRYSQLPDLVEGILQHVAKGFVARIEFLAFHVRQNDPVLGTLEDHPEFLFRFLQRPLRLPAVGDVVDDGEEYNGARGRNQLKMGFHRIVGAVLAAVNRLEYQYLALPGNQRLDHGAERFFRVRRLDIDRSHGSQFFHAVAEVAQATRVDEFEAQRHRIECVDFIETAGDHVLQPGVLPFILIPFPVETSPLLPPGQTDDRCRRQGA